MSKACPIMGVEHALAEAKQPEHGPRVPIPGAAGASIYAALSGMAMHAGPMTITITKSRMAGGGYAYSIARNLTPASR